jgi:hypothetical protein
MNASTVVEMILYKFLRMDFDSESAFRHIDNIRMFPQFKEVIKSEMIRSLEDERFLEETQIPETFEVFMEEYRRLCNNLMNELIPYWFFALENNDIAYVEEYGIEMYEVLKTYMIRNNPSLIVSDNYPDSSSEYDE